MTKAKNETTVTVKETKRVEEVPVCKVRMMSDEEWNALAYRNMLERKAVG